jgi:hypothetical protein
MNFVHTLLFLPYDIVARFDGCFGFCPLLQDLLVQSLCHIDTSCLFGEEDVKCVSRKME